MSTHTTYLRRSLFAVLLFGISTLAFAAHSDNNHSNATHSDQLLCFYNIKSPCRSFKTAILTASPKAPTSNARKKHLDQALPALSAYLAIPKGHYPNTDMYRQSLDNRAAMLEDFSQLMNTFYHQIQTDD